MLVIGRVGLALEKQLVKSKCSVSLPIPDLRLNVTANTICPVSKAIKSRLLTFPEYFKVHAEIEVDLQKVVFIWAATAAHIRLSELGEPENLPVDLLLDDDTTIIEFCEAMDEWYLKSIRTKKRKK